MSDEEKDQVAFEHMSDTQFIQRFCKKLIEQGKQNGHICFQGERLANIETTQKQILDKLGNMQSERKDENKAIKEDLKDHNEKIDKKFDALFDGRNANAKDIAVIKNTIYCIITGVVGLAGFAAWMWEQIKEFRELLTVIHR